MSDISFQRKRNPAWIARFCSMVMVGGMEVQDALLQAMRQWPFKGIPPNPSAWLMQTQYFFCLPLRVLV